MSSNIQSMHDMEVCRANVGAKDDNVFVWDLIFSNWTSRKFELV